MASPITQVYPDAIPVLVHAWYQLRVDPPFVGLVFLVALAILFHGRFSSTIKLHFRCVDQGSSTLTRDRGNRPSHPICDKSFGSARCRGLSASWRPHPWNLLSRSR